MLRSLSIKVRLLLLVVCPIVVLVGTASTTSSIMLKQHQDMVSLYQDRVVPLQQIKATSDSYGIAIVDLFHKYRGQQISQPELVNSVNQARQKASQTWQAYKETLLTEREKSLIAIADQNFAKASQLIDRYLAAVQNQTFLDIPGPEFIHELYRTFDPLTVALEELIQLQLDVSAEFIASSADNFTQTKTLLLTICLLALSVILVAGLLIYRSINQPINSLIRDLNYIAERSDLRHRIPVESSDELAQLARTQNHMLERFHQILQQLRDAVHQSSVASEEMSAIASQVSQTVSRQNDQIISVTSSITEMSGAVREVANSAAETANQATIANNQTLTGNQQINANVASISHLSECVEHSDDIVNRLHQQSGAISEVLTVIRSIAERTNLLALNAAIESARAGEAGRGFAVVADEVRALAQNTQTATESIGEMINVLQSSSMEAVGILQEARSRAAASVSTTEATGQLLKNIAGAVGKINDMNLQVSAATEQQAAVSDDILRTVVLFRQALDEVSENARQSAIASNEIARLSSSLQQQVAVFVI